MQHIQRLYIDFDGKNVVVVSGRDGIELWADESPELSVDRLGCEWAGLWWTCVWL